MVIYIVNGLRNRLSEDVQTLLVHVAVAKHSPGAVAGVVRNFDASLVKAIVQCLHRKIANLIRFLLSNFSQQRCKPTGIADVRISNRDWALPRELRDLKLAEFFFYLSRECLRGYLLEETTPLRFKRISVEEV